MYKITKITYKIVKKDRKIFVVFKVLCQKRHSIVLTLHICNDIITLVTCKVIYCVYTYKLW